MSDISARFEWKGQKKSISTGIWQFGQNFKPPGVGDNDIIIGGVNTGTDERTSVQFNFEVRLLVGSEPEGRRERERLQGLLDEAGDDNNPLYLAWRGHSLFDKEPAVGQFGAYRRYAVITGRVTLGKHFTASDTSHETGYFVDIKLKLKPKIFGLRSLLFNGFGAIRVAHLDFEPNGAYFLGSRSASFNDYENKFTNPVFNNGIAPIENWNYGWTAGTGIIATRVTGRENVGYGEGAVSLVAVAGAGNTWTQSLNAGDTNTHTLSFVAARADGGTISSSDCQPYHNGTAVSATYTLWEERANWWIVEGTVAAINGSTTVGAVVANGKGVTVDGFAYEERAYRTQPAIGDYPGEYWNGLETAGTTLVHKTETNRQSSRLRMETSNALNAEAGSMYFALNMAYAQNEGPFGDGDVYLLSTDTSTPADEFGVYWDQSEGKWAFSEGINTVRSAADTWARGAKKFIVVSWGPDGIKIYIEDAAVVSGTYSPTAYQTYLFLGSRGASGAESGHHNCINLGFGIYTEQWSDAQAAAVYAAVKPVLTAGLAIDEIPVYSVAGGLDGLAYNEDSSDVTQENFFYASGIVGNIPAITEWMITVTNGMINADDLFLSLNAVHFNDNRLVPSMTNSGTVSVSTIDVAGATSSSYGADGRNVPHMLQGKNVYPFVRVTDAGSGLKIKTRIAFEGGTLERQQYIDASTADGTARVMVLNPVTFPPFDTIFGGVLQAASDIVPIYKRASGTADVVESHLVLMTDPILRISTQPNDSHVGDTLYITGRRAYITEGGPEHIVNEKLTTRGDPVDLEPNKLNVVMQLIGGIGAAGNEWRTNALMRFISCFATPVWRI